MRQRRLVPCPPREMCASVRQGVVQIVAQDFGRYEPGMTVMAGARCRLVTPGSTESAASDLSRRRQQGG